MDNFVVVEHVSKLTCVGAIGMDAIGNVAISFGDVYGRFDKWYQVSDSMINFFKVVGARILDLECDYELTEYDPWLVSPEEIASIKNEADELRRRLRQAVEANDILAF